MRDTFTDAPTKRSKLLAEIPFRRKLVAALAPLDAFPVENSAAPGTPDVNYIEGWIELKCVDVWPKKVNGIVRIDKFKAEQRATLLRRKMQGGRAFLLLCRPSDMHIYILPAIFAAEHAGRCPELALREHALYNGPYSDRAMLKFFHEQNGVAP